MQRWLSIRLLLVVIAALSITACSKYEYDWKALGFASEADMEAAHKVGYHTKAKLGGFKDEVQQRPTR